MKKLAAPMKSFGNLILMTLICIAIFIVFMALRPANAGMQGNLPTPVQALPKYPPVICVAPDWVTEICEDRQTPLPKSNPLRAFARERAPKVRTVLYDEPGGELSAHVARWQALAQSDDDVEIRGPCDSACILIMGYVPTERLCFGEYASLRFHPVRDAITDTPLEKSTKWMINSYPQDIRLWIESKGGWEKMALMQMWTLSASKLWAMGYRKCEPEAAPVPWTKRDAMKNYRSQWN